MCTVFMKKLVHNLLQAQNLTKAILLLLSRLSPFPNPLHIVRFLDLVTFSCDFEGTHGLEESVGWKATVL